MPMKLACTSKHKLTFLKGNNLKGESFKRRPLHYIVHAIPPFANPVQRYVDEVYEGRALHYHFVWLSLQLFTDIIIIVINIILHTRNSYYSQRYLAEPSPHTIPTSIFPLDFA